MNLKQILCFHTWQSCKCTRCGKKRDKDHDWSKDCETCARCGKMLEGGHNWKRDCQKCAQCGKLRNAEHDWSTDCEKCAKCSQTRVDAHEWSKSCEKCTKCGRKGQHRWSPAGTFCLVCGAARGDIVHKAHEIGAIAIRVLAGAHKTYATFSVSIKIPCASTEKKLYFWNKARKSLFETRGNDQIRRTYDQYTHSCSEACEALEVALQEIDHMALLTSATVSCSYAIYRLNMADQEELEYRKSFVAWPIDPRLVTACIDDDWRSFLEI